MTSTTENDRIFNCYFGLRSHGNTRPVSAQAQSTASDPLAAAVKATDPIRLSESFGLRNARLHPESGVGVYDAFTGEKVERFDREQVERARKAVKAADGAVEREPSVEHRAAAALLRLSDRVKHLSHGPESRLELGGIGRMLDEEEPLGGDAGLLAWEEFGHLLPHDRRVERGLSMTMRHEMASDLLWDAAHRLAPQDTESEPQEAEADPIGGTSIDGAELRKIEVHYASSGVPGTCKSVEVATDCYEAIVKATAGTCSEQGLGLLCGSSVAAYMDADTEAEPLVVMTDEEVRMLHRTRLQDILPYRAGLAIQNATKHGYTPMDGARRLAGFSPELDAISQLLSKEVAA